MQLLCTMIFLKLNLSLHTCTENRSSVTYKVESHRPRQLITVSFYIVSFYGYVRLANHPYPYIVAFGESYIRNVKNGYIGI